MKKLGLVGGTSWVSTIDYYRLINEKVNQHLGEMNYAECIIYSLNYEEVKNNNERRDFDANLQLVGGACRHLELAGADALVLCANTTHMFAHQLVGFTRLPVIHIAEATADAILKQGLQKVALLGTRMTMELDFFKAILAAKNIEMMIPGDAEREIIHRSIFDELGKGLMLPATRENYLQIIRSLILGGAEGIIFGCTEIPMLIKPEDVAVPVFDTLAIHAEAAARFAVGA